MAGLDLVFKQPAAPVVGGPVELVFGESGTTLPDTVEVTISGRITGLRGTARLHAGVRASAVGRITGLRGVARASWDANVSRVTRADLGAAWQAGTPVAAAVGTAWQQSQPVRTGAIARWQEGRPAVGGLRSHWQEMERLRASAQGHWQEGRALRGAVDVAWEEMLRLRASAQGHWQEGRPLRGAVDAAWEEMLRLRASAQGHWQEARTVRAVQPAWFGDGVPVRVTLRPHWQEAMRPRAGVGGITPPQPQPCYVPGVPVHLVFRKRASSELPLNLVFVCDGHGTTTPPGHTVVVPGRRSYIVLNSVEVRRADSLAGDPLPAEEFRMQLDRRSWTWTFSGVFHASARDALALEPGGQPLELEVRVNGQPFRMLAERVGRRRAFPEHQVTVRGRGRAALLDAQVQTFGNPLGLNASQLMTDVLMLNGAAFGWSVDFQLGDWMVPAGAWMHQGTYISALADIAGAVGGYLQPADTAGVIRVLPAWPRPWWDWDLLVPDFDLPAGIAEVDDVEVTDRPDFNRIFVSGLGQGITADLTRGGTAGDVLKQPMVVHPLIVNLDAAKQRAIAELSESGRGLIHKATLPVLPEMGVIKPGHILGYYDDVDVRRKGIVRSTDLSLQWPVLTQTLEIESHD